MMVFNAFCKGYINEKAGGWIWKGKPSGTSIERVFNERGK